MKRSTRAPVPVDPTAADADGEEPATADAGETTYGAIGAVFSILTWLVMIGAALIVGPVAGAVWQQRAARPEDEE